MAENKKEPMNNNRIKEIRLSKHKTQKDLAQLLGVSEQAIAYYEKALREPPLRSWVKMANYLGVPVSYLQGFGDYNYEDKAEIKKYSDEINKRLGYKPSKEESDEMLWHSASEFSYKLHDQLLSDLNAYFQLFLNSENTVLSHEQITKLKNIFNKIGFTRQNELDFDMSMLFYLFLSRNLNADNKKDLRKVEKILQDFYNRELTSSNDIY
ncbi:helix-turn-helix domain-containing protein [Limosilactobacillus vaginalis]|uniref:helix-turn-helix domain-containing protein n=1 Tax=Limosilactobacillus vaginalis TaxID=1633 RepID=UPI00241C1DE2|nr:helix-turn-helix transcriptional regulator [Limosilactobacillus vaginalis]